MRWQIPFVLKVNLRLGGCLIRGNLTVEINRKRFDSQNIVNQSNQVGAPSILANRANQQF